MSKQRRFITLLVIAAAVLLGRRLAAAVGGSQKAPMELFGVRPNATHAGSDVTLFSPGLPARHLHFIGVLSGTNVRRQDPRQHRAARRMSTAVAGGARPWMRGQSLAREMSTANGRSAL